VTLDEVLVDVQTIVSVSMLPVSRNRAAAAFKDLRHACSREPLEAVLEACNVPEESRASHIAEALERSERALNEAARLDIEPLTIFDDRYPPLLSCTADPPPVLWIRGNVECLSAPAVAVVGSRAATPYALQVAERLGEELAQRGVVVVSGLARGVDSAAHRGCLGGNGSTVAVLGSGLDRIYPPEHEQLAVSICRAGLLASELGPGAAPLQEHFPQRNRIISGISLAVVVVEASEKSGSLITARCALEQGRDVMAVPGSVLSGRNRGSHGLLKDGAKVVETADDILEELGWRHAPETPVNPAKSLIGDPLLARMEHGEGYRLEELIVLSGIPAPRLLTRLTELELNGLVVRTSAGRFARASRPE
jgi:DNA processing protein